MRVFFVKEKNPPVWSSKFLGGYWLGRAVSMGNCRGLGSCSEDPLSYTLPNFVPRRSNELKTQVPWIFSHSGPDLTVLQCEVWCQDVGKWKGWNWKKFQGLVCVIIIAVKLFYKDREAVCACWVCMCESERLNDWAGCGVRDLQFRIWRKNDKREPTKLSFSAGTQLQFHI